MRKINLWYLLIPLIIFPLVENFGLESKGTILIVIGLIMIIHSIIAKRFSFIILLTSSGAIFFGGSAFLSGKLSDTFF